MQMQESVGGGGMTILAWPQHLGPVYRHRVNQAGLHSMYQLKQLLYDLGGRSLCDCQLQKQYRTDKVHRPLAWAEKKNLHVILEIFPLRVKDLLAI